MSNQAESTLAKHNGAIFATAQHYSQVWHVPIADLVQEGNIAVLRAAEKFDPRKGTFRHYANLWMQARMVRFCHRNCCAVSLPPPQQWKGGKSPVQEVTSFDAHPVITENDWVKGSHRPNPGEDQYNTISQEAASELPTPADLAAANNDTEYFLSILDPKERRVIRHRFWDNLTLDKIGRRFRVCKERIRQIEEGALLKMRRAALAEPT